MDLAICAVPAAPVRKERSHKVEMVNQLLFGEKMFVHRKKNNWWQIQSCHDNYEGWVRNNLVVLIDEAPGHQNRDCITAELFNVVTLDGVRMNIPAACNLPALSKEQGFIGNASYKYVGNSIRRDEVRPSGEMVRSLALQWLNAPYLWGGRTAMGVDCSGFVQVIMKMMGLDLLRDARQQVGQGIKVKSLTDARTGDLAFFDKRGKITHVGILLDPQQIIHASGQVRIDRIDEKGIINTTTGKRTHLLAAIRRYW